MSLLSSLAAEVPGRKVLRIEGRVTAVRGPILIAALPHTAIGDWCSVIRRDGSVVRAQVVSFSGEEVCLAPFDDLEGVSPGAKVESDGAPGVIRSSAGMFGRVVDCFGIPLAGSAQTPENSKGIPIAGVAPRPFERSPINELFLTGVAAIDGLCTLGVGQRIGLFAGAGVGKSTLLGMLARNASVDLTVIALVGERGREVREFVEDSLGEEGLRRAVVVVSTSDEPPIRRALAVDTATAIAEDFRSRGKRVLLLVDSLTRAARALRDVGLAAGELPIRQGYTASVYSKLPKMLERAGAASRGSITAVYTVLTNGEGESDPLGEEIKSLLDGHIVLDSKMAERGVRPAIDPTASISRLMSRLHGREYIGVADAIRGILARLKRDRDILLFGGTPDRELAAALQIEPELWAILTQPAIERRDRAAVEGQLSALVGRYRALLQ